MSLELGKAVRVDGFDEPMVIANVHGDGRVTVHDLNQAAHTVQESDITVV